MIFEAKYQKTAPQSNVEYAVVFFEVDDLVAAKKKAVEILKNEGTPGLSWSSHNDLNLWNGEAETKLLSVEERQAYPSRDVYRNNQSF